MVLLLDLLNFKIELEFIIDLIVNLTIKFLIYMFINFKECNLF